MKRGLETGIWEHPWFAALSIEAKLLYLYLITHGDGPDHHIHHARIPFDLGIGAETLPKVLDSLRPKITWELDGPALNIHVRNYADFIGDAGRLSGHEWMLRRKQVFERDNFTCKYCGARGVRLECDHIIPVSQGGSNELDNLITACFTCNRAKRGRTLDEWGGPNGLD